MSKPEAKSDGTSSGIYASTYLSIPEVEKLVRAYEESPIAHNLGTLISFLLALAFNLEGGWVIKYDSDNQRKQTNYYVMKVNKKDTDRDNNKSLHTLVKVILNPDDSFPKEKEWERSIHGLENAPMNEDRCWVILIRGLELRLLEYHRDQKPGIRAIPCDFFIEGQTCETVHIRSNVTEVNNVLARLPGHWPEALSATELVGLAAQLKAAEQVAETKSSSDNGWEPPESILVEAHEEAFSHTVKPTADSGDEVLAVASQLKHAAETKPTAPRSGVAPKAKPDAQSETFALDEATAEIRGFTKDVTEGLDNAGRAKAQSDIAKVLLQDKQTPQDKASQIEFRTQVKPNPPSQDSIDPQDLLTQVEIIARLKSMADEKTKEDFKNAVKAKIQLNEKLKIQCDEARAAARLEAQDKASIQPSIATPVKTSSQPKPAGNGSSKADFFAQARKLAQLKSNAAMRTKPVPQAKPTAHNETHPSGAISPKSKSDKDS
jgi:hypothetical protein